MKIKGQLKVLGKKQGARPIKKKLSKVQEKRSRKRSNVDAWDSGAAERAEQQQLKRNSKKIKFTLQPATFQPPSESEILKKRLGEFAGPLLGALWEENNPVSITKSRSSTITVENRFQEAKRENPFSVLATSSSDEEEYLAQSKPSLFQAPVLKPEIFSSVQSTLPKLLLKKETASFLFKPATFDPANSSKNIMSSTTPSVKFELKPSSFTQVGEEEADNDVDL